MRCAVSRARLSFYFLLDIVEFAAPKAAKSADPEVWYTPESANHTNL